MFDCHKSFATEFKKEVKQRLEQSALEYTGSDLFTVDVKSGNSWADCKV